MGNRKWKNRARGLIGCVSSFALAFSLFAMPAMAVAQPQSDEKQAQNDQSGGFDHPGVANAFPASNSAEDNGVNIGDPSAEAGQLGGDVVLDIGSPDSTDDADSPSESLDDQTDEPSIFDSLFQFFSDISPFSVTPENMQDASIRVTLNTLVARAAQAAGNDLTLTLRGTTGGGNHEAHFQPRPTSYSNFITDAHSGSGDAQVRATANTEFIAEIHNIPAGTYGIEVTGAKYGKYTHGATVTLNDGDLADFSLVDSLYGDPIPADNKRIGLVPYGDFNDDGRVDDGDSAKIAQAVHESSTDVIFDLTGDGKVDLADVQHFAHTVNKSHPAAEVHIMKDVSQMDSSFNEGTSAGLKPGGTGSVIEDPTQAADDLLYEDGNTIVLRHETGANITDKSPVGFTVDSKGVGIGAFVIQFPRDENNKPYNMGGTGRINLKLDDPIPSDEESDKIYDLYADIQEATGNIEDLVPPDNPDKEEHPYDFMYQRLRAYLFTETGQLVIVFSDKITPVKLRSVEVIFTSTTDPTNKTIEISHAGFVDSVDDLNLPVFPDAPEVTGVETGDEQVSLMWLEQDDAISYDVEIGIDNKTDVYSTSAPSITIDSHSTNGNLQNDIAYSLRVRSVGLNGNSAWSSPVSAVPEDRTAPSNIAAPTLSAGYSQITASWEPVDNADSYILYFKKKDDATFSSAELAATSYTVKNLESYTEYEFYLAAENEYGLSEASATVSATTTSAGGKIPWFNLINRASQNADLFPSVNSFSAVAVDGLDDEAAAAIVDGNFDTYANLGDASEDKGGVNATASVTLKEPQDLQNIAFTTYMGEGYADGIENVYVRVLGKDGDDSQNDGELFTLDNGLSIRSVPVEGGAEATSVNTVYVELPYTIAGAETVRISFTRTGGLPATISELALYSPSGLEGEIAGIWADETHISLSKEMDEGAFDSLAKKIEQRDEASSANGHQAEMHPLASEFAAEVANARQMLNFDDPITVGVNTQITTANSAIGGMNAWQPLGISAKAGDSVKVYVSTPSNATGEATKLRLVASQYMGGRDSQFAPVGYLLSGMNEITIPEIGELPEGVNVERGGALYLEYTGDSAADSYNVSVLGGTRIPTLDLSRLSEDADRLRSERIMQYAMTLEEYVNTLSSAHSAAGHAGTGFFGMFVDSDCSANLTEIVTDRAVLTLPATRVVLELGSTDRSEVADKIAEIVDGVDEMIEVAYQHKGLFDVSENPNLTRMYGANNDIPGARHNIRCMSLGEGEGVCSTNNYIGITWDGVTNVLNIRPIESATDGTYDSGEYLGFEIAHALGHQLTDNAAAIPEVTANYFTQLLTSNDTDDSAVFNWDDVYSRVTSNASGELDARLGAACLWQLHLAYDEGFSHAFYADPDDEMANLIFARMNAYARNVDRAPYGLTLDGADAQNKLMRLAFAAADRNLIGFFKAWGMEPDSTTFAYASNFAKERRAIQYLTDDLNREAAVGVGVGVDDVDVSAEIRFDRDAQNVVIDKIASEGMLARNVHAYEILRKAEDNYIPVGIVSGKDASFVESAVSLEQNDVEYRVRAIDNACNVSEMTDVLTVRVEHAATEGGVANFTMATDKSKWNITSNMVSTDGATSVDDAFATMGCASAAGTDLSAAADGDTTTAFTGNVLDAGAKHQITIAMNDTIDVSGIRYYPSSKESSFKGIDIEVSKNGKDWTLVNTSMLYFPATDNYKGYDAFGRSESASIYFSEADSTGDPAKADMLATYSASYIRLTEWCDNTDPVSIAEIDVISSPVYKVSLLGEDAHFGMGKLTHDVTLEHVVEIDGDEQRSDIFIPKGSFVIMGDCTGNPVYNTVVVKDQAGNVVADPSQQIIITDKVASSDAAIIDSAAMVFGGTWLYYFEPGTYENRLEEWGAIHPELFRTDGGSSISDAKLVAVGSAQNIQRQGINDEMYVDLFGITLNFGAYDVHR